MFATNGRHHRRVGAAIVGAGLALLLGLGACGDNPAEPAVATAESRPAPTVGPSLDPVAQYVEGQRKWVACVRQAGYNLPDPDAKGHVDFGEFLTSSKLPKTDPGLLAALDKCAGVRPTVPAELQPSLPPVSAEQLENRRRYAKCMRDNGVRNWPDPGPSGEFPTENFVPDLASPDADIRALQICDPVLDGRKPATFDPNKIPNG